MRAVERFVAAGLALAFLILLAAPVFAASITYTGTAPTTREDGSPLAASEIAGYRIEYGTCVGTAFGTKSGEQVFTGTATTWTVTGLAPATTYCARSYTRDTAGRESSKPSAVASKTTPDLSPPGSPGGFTATVATIAGTNLSPVFRLDDKGRRDVYVAGLIEAGAQCSGPVLFRYRGASFRKIAAKDVDAWFVRPSQRVAAACAPV